MYARFLFALCIAAGIFTLSAVSRAAISSQNSVITVQAMNRIAASPNGSAVRLPTVVVRPDAQARRALAKAEAAETVGTNAAERATGAFLGARNHVAKVSMLIPYYSFGSGTARGVE